jgi:hypothetical protein
VNGLRPLKKPSFLRGEDSRGRLSLQNPLKDKFQSKLNLPGRECSVGFQKVLGLLVVGRIRKVAGIYGVWREGGRFRSEPIGSDGDAIIGAIEKIERVGSEF